MQRWKNRLAEIGRVVTFDYPYLRENRKRPDPLAQLIAAHRRALADAVGSTTGIIQAAERLGAKEYIVATDEIA